MHPDPVDAAAAEDPKTAKKKRRLLTRRRFFMYGVPAALGLYTWRIEPHWIQIVERDLPIDGLPKALMGRRLLQLSDLHVGPDVDPEYLIAAMAKASALRPDMVVITGDLMSADAVEQVDNAARVLQHLERPPLGCFAILGNHDYGHRWTDPKVADRIADRLVDLGITPLRNERAVVEGLQLVGLDDFWGPNFNPTKAFTGVDWSGPTLTLCHNPDAVDHDDFLPCRGWVLAGHTHGGQCKPPFLPPPILPVKNKRYTAGVIDVRDGLRLYINRALGHLTRVRFNVRPEITCFRMTAARTA